MEKPLILKELEMKEAFAGVINEYAKDVPYMHMASVLESLLLQVNAYSEQQIALTKAEWEKQKDPEDES